MSRDFLVEIGTEELPPKVLRELSESFTAGIASRLTEQQLRFSEVVSYAAPRRLAVWVKELAEQAPDHDSVSWGPPVKVAFDTEGNITKAAQVFASKNGLEVSALSGLVENDGQQDKLCLRQTIAGSTTRVSARWCDQCSRLPRCLFPSPCAGAKAVRSLCGRCSGQ